MTKVKITYISDIAQQLSYELKELNNLMSKAWVQHELTNSRLIDLQNAYKQFSLQIGKTCKNADFKKIMNDFMEISENV